MIKKTFKILGILILILGLIAFLIPLLYKKEIFNKIQTEASKQINGKLKIEDISISLLKKFPLINIDLHNLSLQSYAISDSAEIIQANKISLAFDFWGLFHINEGIDIKKIAIDNAKINITIDENGKANYDIAKSDPSTPSESNALKLKLNEYSINNTDIKFHNDSSKFYTAIINLNHRGSGDFANNILDLQTSTSIDSLSLISDGMKYLNKVTLNSKLNINIDQNKNLYTLKENDIQINDLKTKIIGSVQLKEDNTTTINLSIDNPSASFKELFSLIPNAYTKDYKDVKANGTYTFKAKIDGDLNSDKKTYPDWDIALHVMDGSLQYPNMPASIESVKLNLTSKNKGPSMDNQVLSITPFHFLLNKKTCQGNINITNLTHNPHINGDIKADISLDDYKQFIPLDPGTNLSGLIHCDAKFDFTQSQVDNQDFEHMVFDGNANVQNLIYKDAASPQISISRLQLLFNPKQIDIKEAQTQLGKSDLLINATLSNPLALTLSNSIADGNINMHSNLLDLNEWMSDEASDPNIDNSTSTVLAMSKKIRIKSGAEISNLKYEDYDLHDLKINAQYQPDKLTIEKTNFDLNGDKISMTGNLDQLMDYVYLNKTLQGNLNINAPSFNLTKFMGEETTTTTSTEVFLVPKLMNLNIGFNVGSLLYDKITMNQLKGAMQVANDEIVFNDMSTAALGGKMLLNGKYNTADANKPLFDLKYDLQSIQFPKAFEQVLSFKAIAPIAKFIEGIFNSSFTARGVLGKDMMPDLKTISVGGLIETINGAIKGFKPVEGIADKLNISELKTINIQNTKNWFNVENGVVSLREMAKKINDIDMKVSGTHQIAGDMNYKFIFKIPKSKWNQNIAGVSADQGINYLKGLAGKAGVNFEVGNFVNLAVNLTGKYNDPKFDIKFLSTDGQSIDQTAKDVAIDIAKKAEDSIRNRANQEVDKAKQKILNEAKRVEDSLRLVAQKKADEAKQKALDKAEEEAKKHLDSNLVKKGKEVLNDKLGKDASKVLNEGGKKEIDKAKEKLKDIDIFKKKK